MNVHLHRNFVTGSFMNVRRAVGHATVRRRTLRMRLHAALITLDVIAILTGFFVAQIIYQTLGENQYFQIVGIIVPVYLLIAIKTGGFSVYTMRKPDISRVTSTQSLLIAASFTLFMAIYARHATEFPRVLFGTGLLISMAFLVVMRTIFSWISRSMLGHYPYEVVLISEDIETVVAHDVTVRLAASDFDPKSECPFMYDRLALALKDADRVIVSCTPERRIIWVNALIGANIQAEVLVPELAKTRAMAVSAHNGIPTIVVAKGPLKIPDRIAKRAVDIFVAASVLILLAPVLAVTALVIKLDSPGPVFFVQTRIGRSNQMFKLFKFRSMTDGTADGHGTRSTDRRDDRITAVGRFIRATSIDELPQLWNVLRGNMSIVGPRPHAIGSRAENLLFWEIDPRYWHRHSAKPGLTGLAQVRGYRGTTNLRNDLTNRLDADLEYINNWSLWNDFKIVLRTIGVVIHKNAY